MGVGQSKNREVLDRYLAFFRNLEASDASIPTNLDEIHQAFEERVKRALQDLPANRRKRLQEAPRLPERVSRSVTLFLRNPDVVAEVLVRARGVCDACKKSAPFVRRSDGTPYLEVHHMTPLADGGEDTVDNAMALCPNCHRQEHFGIPIG
jgi:5-methylcytosine-specific restriction protein A